MASSYPTSLDSFSTTHVGGETIVAGTDNDQADAINKIESELGTNPSGDQTSLKSRLDSTVKHVVNHGATASTARPTGVLSVEWIGSVQPTNAVNGDTWINTA